MKREVFKIEKGLPIPASRGGSAGRKPGQKPPKYPFEDMEIGDSFDAPRDMGVSPAPSYADRRQTAIAAHAYRWCRDFAPDREYTTRLIDGSTVRCWRIK